LVKKNNGKIIEGVLPSSSWLRKNGYGGLCACVYKRPEDFTHIRQNYKGGRSIEENIKIAERLARENNGKLPCYSWLKKNRYKGLLLCIMRNKDKFEHIKQEKKLKSIEEHIKIAEYLANKYNGVLPEVSWLLKNGYIALYTCMRNYPEDFKHIKQEKKLKNIEGHIRTAEKLANKHNGVLPCCDWLIKNRYIGLYKCKLKHIEFFKHIKQEKRLIKKEEHIKIAEKLAKENNGILPCCSWLRKNKYNGLIFSIRKYPEKFSHIKQENKGGKNLEDNIEDAEKLVKENNGVLPCCDWLTENGHGGLLAFIINHPENFKNMKQEYYKPGEKSKTKYIRTIGKK